jgi:hypothetical protein
VARTAGLKNPCPGGYPRPVRIRLTAPKLRLDTLKDVEIEFHGSNYTLKDEAGEEEDEADARETEPAA